MNIFLKKRIMAYSAVLLLILIISSFFIKVETINIEGEKIIPVVIRNSEKGSIDFNENDYFKKYTINCTKDIVDLKLKENNSSFQITLDKTEIANIDVNNDDKISLSEVNSEANKTSFIIDFKKLNEDENYVHLDYSNKKKILVFIKKKNSPYKYKVVVDPGHGGVDVGVPYGKVFEKDINLKISKYMVDNLRYNGYEVILTRDKDMEFDKIVKQDLIKRAAIANDNKADVFVSVHVNSNKETHEYNGVSTYNYDAAGAQKTEGIKLAQTIQKEILKSDGWKNMGEHGENLSVLRRTKMPGALVECGFLTNPQDRARLLKEETLVNFGLNISNGVIKYLTQAKTNK